MDAPTALWKHRRFQGVAFADLREYPRNYCAFVMIGETLAMQIFSIGEVAMKTSFALG